MDRLCYRITVDGEIGPRYAAAFHGMEIRAAHGRHRDHRARHRPITATRAARPDRRSRTDAPQRHPNEHRHL